MSWVPYILQLLGIADVPGTACLRVLRDSATASTGAADNVTPTVLSDTAVAGLAAADSATASVVLGDARASVSRIANPCGGCP